MAPDPSRVLLIVILMLKDIGGDFSHSFPVEFHHCRFTTGNNNKTFPPQRHKNLFSHNLYRAIWGSVTEEQDGKEDICLRLSLQVVNKRFKYFNLYF